MNKKKTLKKILQLGWFLWLVNLHFYAVAGALVSIDIIFFQDNSGHSLPEWFVYYGMSFVLMVMYSDSMLIEKFTSKIPRPHLKHLLVFYTVVLIPLISFLVVNGYCNQTLWKREVLALPLFIGGILYLGLVTYVKEKLKLKEKQAYALATAAKEETDEQENQTG